MTGQASLEAAGAEFLMGLRAEADGDAAGARAFYRLALQMDGRVSSARAFLAASQGCELVQGNLRLKACKRGSFLYMVNDFLGQCMHLYGEWCDAEYELMQLAVHEGSTVVDVGANIGAFSVPLARRVGPLGRVYAFEPQRIVHQLLAANVALNGLLNVYTLQQAAGDGKEDTVWLPTYVADSDKLLNMGAKAAAASPDAGGEAVRAVTVDVLDLPRVDLMKIDVEGAELQVLRGAGSTIARSRPALLVEDNETGGNPELLSHLRELDYRAYWHIVRYYQPANHFGCAFSQHDHFDPSVNLWCLPREREHELPPSGLLPVLGNGDNWRAAVARGALR